MFVYNAYFLSTVAIKNDSFSGGEFNFGLLSSRKTARGILVKDHTGSGIEVRTNTPSAETHLLLHRFQNFFGEEDSNISKIENAILSKRIVDYLRNYFGEVRTNCSTFVDFLRTGNFVECDLNKSYFMFTGGMNRYLGQPIKPGDSICIFYYNKRARSRRTHKKIRNHYKSMSKTEGNLRNLRGEKKSSFTAKELYDLYNCGFYRDFHFMFCIDIKNGEPVFIQQVGWNDPTEGRSLYDNPIIVSAGMTDVNDFDTPACMFIKKGR